jgi:hypothetical protein
MMTRPDEHDDSGHATPPDPLIEEVRELRRMLLDRCGDDFNQLAAHLQQIENANRDRLVDFTDEWVRKRTGGKVA